MRINALKATAVSGGAESTSGLWILLHENTKAKNDLNDAIPLRELLVGTSRTPEGTFWSGAWGGGG
jgi:hypothetical protein